MPRSSNERKLLVTCVKAQLDGTTQNLTALKACLSQELDWNFLLQITSANRVIPHVWRSLAPLEKLLPKPIARQMQSAYNNITAHHAAHIQELKRLLILLQQNGISSIPLKGPVIGRLYEHPALREWSDLDILIRRSDIERFHSLLPLLGYQEARQQYDFEDLLDKYHSYNIIKTDGTTCIDVHWQVADEQEHVCYPADSIWALCRKTSFYDFHALVQDSENLLLHTCMHHGLRHTWSELRLIADWVLILRNTDRKPDWEKLLKRAGQIGIRRAFLIGMELARQVFDHEVPAYLHQQIVADKSIRKATRHIKEALFRSRCGTVPETFRFTNNQFYVRDNGRITWLLAKRYLTPNKLDKAVIHLPRPLHFLYYLIRPARLIRQYGWSYLSTIGGNKSMFKGRIKAAEYDIHNTRA